MRVEALSTIAHRSDCLTSQTQLLSPSSSAGSPLSTLTATHMSRPGWNTSSLAPAASCSRGRECGQEAAGGHSHLVLLVGRVDAGPVVRASIPLLLSLLPTITISWSHVCILRTPADVITTVHIVPAVSSVAAASVSNMISRCPAAPHSAAHLCATTQTSLNESCSLATFVIILSPPFLIVNSVSIL